PGIAFLFARIGHATLFFEPLPGDAGDRIHALAHFIEYVRRTAVIPAEPDAPRDLLDDPQVFSRIARGLQALASELHHPVGVGDRAYLFRPCRRRKYDVGVIARLREENLLYHQVLELGERRARMVCVGIRHRGVLAHDVHAADLVVEYGVHDLHHGQPGL